MDSLSRGLDWGTVQSMSGKSDSTIFTVDKTSIILNGLAVLLVTEKGKTGRLD